MDDLTWLLSQFNLISIQFLFKVDTFGNVTNSISFNNCNIYKYKTGRYLKLAGSRHQFEIEALITRMYDFWW